MSGRREPGGPHTPEISAQRASRRQRQAPALLVGLLLCCWHPPVEARPTPEQGIAGESAPADPEPSGPDGRWKRPLPAYDGRRRPDPGAGEVLAWVPRILLYPAYLVVENVLRRPLLASITAAEKYHVPGWMRWLLLWANEKVGLVPTAYYEFGLDPSIGFFLFVDDLTSPGDEVTVHGGFWGGGWVQLEADGHARVLHDRSGAVFARAGFSTRPDRVYFGIGPDSLREDETRFRWSKGWLELGFAGDIGALHKISTSIRYGYSSFDRGQHPSIETRFPVSSVPGFGGYSTLSGGLQIDLDSRGADRHEQGGTGVRLELFGSLFVDPGLAARFFARWGAEGAGFLDLSGIGHVLALRVYVELLEQIGREPTPFTELVTLGGARRMQGFYWGRLRGESGFVLSLAYRYPIWALFDAELHVSAGNAFGPLLRGLRPGRLHLSTGLALRAPIKRTMSFDLLLAFGTSRLDADDFSLEGVRFHLGFNHGF